MRGPSAYCKQQGVLGVQESPQRKQQLKLTQIISNHCEARKGIFDGSITIQGMTYLGDGQLLLTS